MVAAAEAVAVGGERAVPRAIDKVVRERWGSGASRWVACDGRWPWSGFGASADEEADGSESTSAGESVSDQTKTKRDAHPRDCRRNCLTRRKNHRHLRKQKNGFHLDALTVYHAH